MCIKLVQKLLDTAKVIVLDIEGTTTSISYVKDVLFPYAAQYIEEWVKTHWDDDKMKEVLKILLQDQSKLEGSDGFVLLPPAPSDESELEKYKNKVISHLKWQQSKDFKSTGLKKLQGYIWKKGYLDGIIKGHLYEDVPSALEFWRKSGKKIYIYSSGSIDAQKLLFCNSLFGNLSQYIDGNFDTTVGSKIESDSYLKIAKEIDESPDNIIFFTDRPKEVAAAKKAGMCVVRMARKEENPYLEEEKDFLGLEDATLESFSSLINHKTC